MSKRVRGMIEAEKAERKAERERARKAVADQVMEIIPRKWRKETSAADIVAAFQTDLTPEEFRMLARAFGQAHVRSVR